MINEEDFEDWDLCIECKGNKRVKLFTSFDYCENCDGAGWVPKGHGWKKDKFASFISGAMKS